MPASFHIELGEGGKERLVPDFGDRNLYQTWSATGLLLASQFLEQGMGLDLFPETPESGHSEPPT